MKRVYRVDGGCVLCLECYYQCPVRAISIEENVSAHIDETKCVGCGRCFNDCQAEAIVLIECD